MRKVNGKFMGKGVEGQKCPFEIKFREVKISMVTNTSKPYVINKLY